MATPLSADALVRALRAVGLKVVEHRSWRTHNRNHKGPWGPVNGVMIHHTVTSGTMSSVGLCYNGHSTLPGPLCHGVIAKDGTVYLVGNGRTNHAGLGDDDVLQAVINEVSPLPVDNEANTDGNRHFYGFECINLGDGKDPWPEAQLEAIERVSAAICRAHGWSHRSVVGHLEWQPGKVDPRGFTMDAMRSRIAARLADAATPVPPAVEEDDMPTAKEVAEEVAQLLLRTDGQYRAPADASDYSPDPANSRHWWAGTTVFDVLVSTVRQIDAKVTQLEQTGFTEAQLDALADRLLDKMSGRLAE